MLDIHTRNPIRSVEDLADAKALRSVISLALTRDPIDQEALQVAVWNFVGTERRAGVPPALVIKRLTGLMDEAVIAPASDRQELAHRVILWCVEEYFGCLAGDVLTTTRSSKTPGVGDASMRTESRSHLRLMSRTEAEDSSSATTVEMPVVESDEYRDTPLWDVLAEAVNELIAVGDLSTNTGPDSLVAYLCQQLVAARLIAARGARR